MRRCPKVRVQNQVRPGIQSTNYQWLVVNQNGANVQFKGIGTINGSGNYTFVIWATDGSPDTSEFRLPTVAGLPSTTTARGKRLEVGRS